MARKAHRLRFRNVVLRDGLYNANTSRAQSLRVCLASEGCLQMTVRNLAMRARKGSGGDLLHGCERGDGEIIRLDRRPGEGRDLRTRGACRGTTVDWI